MGDRYRYDIDGDGNMTVLDDREAMTVEEIVSALNRADAAIARVRELEELLARCIRDADGSDSCWEEASKLLGMKL